MATIVICDISAAGLLAADKGLFHHGPPSSDPFCVFTVEATPKPFTVQTKVRRKEINPTWDETLTLQVPAGVPIHDLVVDVFDHDRATANDPLGRYVTSLPAEDKTGRISGVLTEHPKQKKTKAQGSIHFTYSITYQPTNASLAMNESFAPGQFPTAGQEPEAPGKFVIERLWAKGLAAADRRVFHENSSDPYCVITVGSLESVKTQVINNTVDPDWTPTFQGDLEIDVYEPGSRITFQVYDKDRVSKDDFLGEHSFILESSSIGRGKFDATLTPAATSSAAPRVIKGTLHCCYLYKAPVDLGESMTGSKVKLPPGAFGRLVIRNIKCKGLRASDRRLLRSDSSDPFVDVYLRLREVEEHRKTATIHRTLQPSWPDILTFWIYERYFEVVMEVFDEDRLTKNDSLGAYRFEIPDQDTDWTLVDDALGMNPSERKEAKGTISFEYNVQYDEALEWSSSFLPVPRAMLRITQKKVSPVFKPLQTKNFVNHITEASGLITDLIALVIDLIMWSSIPRTAVVFLVSLIVCWRSWFFQTFCAGLTVYLLYAWWNRQLQPAPGQQVRPKVTTPTPPPPPPPPDETQAADGAGLGIWSSLEFMGTITQWAYMGAQTSDMVIDLFTWSDPATSLYLYLGCIALFLISWVIPLNYLCMLVVLYTFTAQSFYWHHPLFAARFPPQRLLMLGIAYVMQLMGQTSDQTWLADVQLEVVEARRLKMGEIAHIGSMFGKAYLPDPFVTASAGGDLKMTHVINNTLDPVYNQDLGVLPVQRLGQKVILQVWDSNEAGGNSFMGECFFRASAYTNEVDAWLPLSRRPGADDLNCLVTGAVRVRYSIQPPDPNNPARRRVSVAPRKSLSDTSLIGYPGASRP